VARKGPIFLSPRLAWSLHDRRHHEESTLLKKTCLPSSCAAVTPCCSLIREYCPRCSSSTLLRKRSATHSGARWRKLSGATGIGGRPRCAPQRIRRRMSLITALP
jgi:hypothetical protein